MHLVRAIIGGMPPFNGRYMYQRIRFDERVNVFVGPNASGKSTLLQMLAVSLIDNFDDSKRPIGKGMPGDTFIGFDLINDDAFDARVERLTTGVELTYYRDGVEYKEWGNPFSPSEYYLLSTSADWPGPDDSPKVPVIHIGAIREGLPSVLDQKNPEAYGATAAEALSGPFSGARTMCAAQLFAKELLSPDFRDHFFLPGRGFRIVRGKNSFSVEVEWAIERADACSQQICAEVIRDSKPHNYTIGETFGRQPSLGDPVTITHLLQMGIDTTDERDFHSIPQSEQPRRSEYERLEEIDLFSNSHIPLYLGHLSAGTEETLLWIRWLALKMAYHYRLAEGWHQKPAILLIDEIENHLHPTWQRRVIPALLEHFPGLQLFATTHSPFVVAGRSAGQVHLLQRDANGVVTVSTNERDVIGWTADEILRTLMGVDEPTDQLTVDRANRLRELRGNEELAPEEEAELQELRRQVNSDLLSRGGPLEAQRERYADLMREFLRSRQSDLAQDGE